MRPYWRPCRARRWPCSSDLQLGFDGERGFDGFRECFGGNGMHGTLFEWYKFSNLSAQIWIVYGVETWGRFKDEESI
jgi:hypothetical protein